MNILVIGDASNLDECKRKFGMSHHYEYADGQQEGEKFFLSADLIFDFIICAQPHQMEVYRDHPKVTAFLNTTAKSLSELAHLVDHKISSTIFGFSGLPTFLDRTILEVSLYRESDQIKLVTVCKNLETEFVIVDDRVGLVTPRVICMIINEAYYTVQEGTAAREDIDQAMMLGTNYPFGPFEWAQKIGIKNVHNVLSSLYEDTKDERYKVCALLKKEYLK